MCRRLTQNYLKTLQHTYAVMETVHQCQRCGYEGSKKDYLMNHLKRKIECTPLLSNVPAKTLLDALYTREKNSYDTETDSYVCGYCNKHYKSSMTKYRHTITCPVKLGKVPAPSVLLATKTSQPITSNADKRMLAVEKKLETVMKELRLHKDEVSTKISTIVVPEVTVKLKKRSRATVTPKIRLLVWKTYMGDVFEGKCNCCKKINITVVAFVCGHIIADADKGPCTVENLRPICATCNSNMSTMNMKTFRTMEHDLSTDIDT